MTRKANTNRSGGSFDDDIIEAVWRKGTPEKDYPGFRKDTCGASMSRERYGDRSSPFGWEIDHIKPIAAGGTDVLSNLQPLQWQNNVHKGDDFPNWQCKIKN